MRLMPTTGAPREPTLCLLATGKEIEMEAEIGIRIRIGIADTATEGGTPAGIVMAQVTETVGGTAAEIEEAETATGGHQDRGRQGRIGIEVGRAMSTGVGRERGRGTEVDTRAIRGGG